jgi:hypothetical protein
MRKDKVPRKEHVDMLTSMDSRAQRKNQPSEMKSLQATLVSKLSELQAAKSTQYSSKVTREESCPATLPVSRTSNPRSE